MNLFKGIKAVNPGFLKTVTKIADDYGPEILTLLAQVAHGLSIASAFKASEEVVGVTQKYEDQKSFIEMTYEPESEERKTELRDAKINRDVHYILAYKWVVLFGLIGTGCDIAANRIQGSKIAGLTVALAASEDKLKKVLNKVKERAANDSDFQAFKNEVRNDIFKDKAKSGDAPFEVGKYDENPDAVLFYDSYLDATFYIPAIQVKDAIDHAKDYIARNHTLNFNKWRGFLGLQDCPAGAIVEWNPLNPFDAKIGSILIDGDEILMIDYGENMPSTHKLK